MSYTDMVERSGALQSAFTAVGAHPQADGRGHHRLRARRRVRARAGLRLPGRRRQRQARPARDPARAHPRRGRHPAAGPPGRAGPGQGADLHRPVRRRRRGAARSGWSTRSSPPRDVYAAAPRAVEPYVGGPAYALRAAKEAIDRGLEVDLDTGLEIERMQFAGLFATADREIGMASFVEHGPGKARSRALRAGERTGARRRGGAEDVQACLRRHQAGPGALPRLGGADLRREVVDLVRRAVHRLCPRPVRRDRRPRGLALRRGARDRRGHGLLLAQPQAGRGASTRCTSPTCRPAWSRRRRRTRPGSGFSVEGRVADAERMPYDDNTFDVVVGHAVIHHIPDVELAMREMLRVLRPGGRFVIAGEPTRIGDRYARALGRVTWKVATTVTALPPLRDSGPGRRRSSTSPPGPPRWRRSSTCTRSTRTSWPGRRCGPGRWTSAPRPRS